MNMSRPPVGGGEGLTTGITSSRLAGGLASSRGIAQIWRPEMSILLRIRSGPSGGANVVRGAARCGVGSMAGASNSLIDSTRFSAEAAAALPLRLWPNTGTEESRKTQPVASFI
jgi:hypothetical protein